MGIRTEEDITDPVVSGSLFENLIIAEMFKQNFHRYQLRKYWFWRDSGGTEIDLLTKKGTLFDIFEIKSTQTVIPALFKGMEKFAQMAVGKVSQCTLVYGGGDIEERTQFRVAGWNRISEY